MKITRTSQLTEITRTRELDVTDAQMENYAAGMFIQDAFPNLSPSDREFIKTGITDEEWDEAFGPFLWTGEEE